MAYGCQNLVVVFDPRTVQVTFRLTLAAFDQTEMTGIFRKADSLCVCFQVIQALDKHKGHVVKVSC